MGNSCYTCRNRWFGQAPNQIALWWCRKNLKLKRDELPILGDDAEMKNHKPCGEWKEDKTG